MASISHCSGFALCYFKQHQEKKIKIGETFMVTELVKSSSMQQRYGEAWFTDLGPAVCFHYFALASNLAIMSSRLSK